MDQNSSTYVYVSPEDPIEKLGLSTRPLNALRRASIRTIGELVQISKSGHVLDIFNIGKKSLAEIQDSLKYVRFVDVPVDEPDASLPDDAPTQASAPVTQIVEVPTISIDVTRWQAWLIEKQISVGLLHEQAKIAGKPIAYWLSVAETGDRHEVYETMASILGASINTCEELAFLFKPIQRQEYITVLLSRYGLDPKTLREVGAELNITRERVRQLGEKLKGIIGDEVNSVLKARLVGKLARMPTLLRMQSALLAAKDMGLDITYRQWERSVRSSGLIGTWTSQDYIAIDPVEAMVAVCNLLADREIPELRVPDNLKDAVELVTCGKPDLPAIVLRTVSERTRRLAKRHTRFSGGVNARWLSQEIEEDIATVESALQALGYTEVSNNWFIQSVSGGKCQPSYHDSFQHALRKMSQYCGPLPTTDICSGVRYNASRTHFSVPPPNVMEQILRIHGCSDEGGLYYWDGKTDEKLTAGESIIMSCLEQNGPVVHHTELAQAFIDSKLSFPSLHATLQRSPLFVRIGTGLYKLRGRSVTRQDIERAEAAGERIPVDPEVEYDKRGTITVSATLSVIAVGTGVILCEQFPNLSGEWDCFVRGRQSGKLCATENEFRRLKEPFESLGCQTGDRLKFTFNTWDRTVTIEKVGG